MITLIKDLKIELETKLEESRRRMQGIDLRVVEAKVFSINI